MVCGFLSCCSHLNFKFRICFKQEFLDVQATIKSGFMRRTYSQIRLNILSKYCKTIIRFCINNSLYIVYNKLSVFKKVLLVVKHAAHLVQSNKAWHLFPFYLITQLLYCFLVQSHKRELCFFVLRLHFWECNGRCGRTTPRYSSRSIIGKIETYHKWQHKNGTILF